MAIGRDRGARPISSGGSRATASADRDVRAIGLTGQCPSVVLVDRRGEPVSAGLIYRDNRASPQADAIRERFGDAAIHRRTGHLPSGFHIAPKLLWLRDHEPAVFARAALALQPRDLVALALTGEAATDGTHAAATLVFDLRGGDWDGGLLADLGLDRSLFPPIGRSDGVVGGSPTRRSPAGSAWPPGPRSCSAGPTARPAPSGSGSWTRDRSARWPARRPA